MANLPDSRKSYCKHLSAESALRSHALLPIAENLLLAELNENPGDAFFCLVMNVIPNVAPVGTATMSLQVSFDGGVVWKTLATGAATATGTDYLYNDNPLPARLRAVLTPSMGFNGQVSLDLRYDHPSANETYIPGCWDFRRGPGTTDLPDVATMTGYIARMVVLDTTPPTNWWAIDTIQGALDGLKGAVGGATQSVRDYASGVRREPPQNLHLTGALSSEMMLRRFEFAALLMDQTSPPTATAGRGYVPSGNGIAPAGLYVVTLSAGDAFNNLGQYMISVGASLTADDNAGAGVRHDIVVIPALATAPVIRLGVGVATDAILTAGDVPLYRLRVPVGGPIAGGDIDDLRQLVCPIDASKLLPATTADLLNFLDTDQVTNAVLLKAILNGAFQADANTRALFQDGIWTEAKFNDHAAKWVMAVPGTWAVDGDGAYVNGAGMAGLVLLDLTLTGLSTSQCLVYDAGTATYQPLDTPDGMQRTVAYQMFPDIPTDGDMFLVYCGATKPAELAWDIGTPGATTGNAYSWFESRAGDTWGAHMPAYDHTDLTANDGQRSFDQAGAQTWDVTPGTWVSATFGGISGFWLACRVTTVANIGAVVPVFTGIKAPERVTPTNGFMAPRSGTVTRIYCRDGAAVLHTTADVQFYLVNFTRGTAAAIQTWVQDARTHGAAVTLAVTKADVLGIIVVVEDTAAEITNAIVEMDVTLS